MSNITTSETKDQRPKMQIYKGEKILYNGITCIFSYEDKEKNEAVFIGEETGEKVRLCMFETKREDIIIKLQTEMIRQGKK